MVDPELGIDVVNLGLIYGIHIDDANIATLDMTLTSAACPLTDVIEDQAKSATEGIVNELRINWVWMPPVGPGQDHRRGPRAAPGAGLQRLTFRRGLTRLDAVAFGEAPRHHAGGLRCVRRLTGSS
ncbi:hypothetical protein GCM10020000_62110 [Streptomyces olivoverticillatus]